MISLTFASETGERPQVLKFVFRSGNKMRKSKSPPSRTKREKGRAPSNGRTLRKDGPAPSSPVFDRRVLTVRRLFANRELREQGDKFKEIVGFHT